MKVTDPDTIQIMKDYMANGRFSRGVTQVHADASLAFVGNLNQPVETLVRMPRPISSSRCRRSSTSRLSIGSTSTCRAGRSPRTRKRHPDQPLWLRHRLPGRGFSALRKQNRFDEVDRHFRFGSHVEGRDATAVATRQSVACSSFFTRTASTRRTSCADTWSSPLEARRRVKEQLKKRGSFEFYRTSFSYIDNEDGTGADGRRCRSRAGKGAISRDPLPPGSVYTAAADDEGKVALYRLEVCLTAGTGKVRTPAGMDEASRNR